MEPLNPIREGYVTRVEPAPGPQETPFFSGDVLRAGEPVTPPPEVLEALDRAARVLSELSRNNVTVSLESSGAGVPRVVLHHPLAASRELSHRALLSLLDGDTSVADRPA